MSCVCVVCAYCSIALCSTVLCSSCCTSFDTFSNKSAVDFGAYVFAIAAANPTANNPTTMIAKVICVCNKRDHTNKGEGASRWELHKKEEGAT